MSEDPARMTLDEAYVLHRWHKDVEADAARRGDYGSARQHKERAEAIGVVFWPADAWEQAWSNQSGQQQR